MRVFEVRNVHSALPAVLAEILRDGVSRDSRNGKVLMFKTPITVVYEQPQERVLFWADRDANPFFHFAESLWMLQGRNDAAFPAQFAKQIEQYSDDKVSIRGAYGFRWRNAFGKDQLDYVIRALKKNLDDRRQVIQMWDANLDLGTETRDAPCNLAATVQINTKGNLDLTVFQRSGDILWGILGANAVHFSMLLEFLAGCIGVPVGRYYQVCTNAHVYQNEVLERCKPIALAERDPYNRSRKEENPYTCDGVVQIQPYPLFPTKSYKNPNGLTEREAWEEDLQTFFDKGVRGQYTIPFFISVAVPMLRAHQIYKEGWANPEERFDAALIAIEQIAASDWRTACREWVLRRKSKREAAQAI